MVEDVEAKEPTRQDRQAGFTLIELLVVIVILGILAAVVVFSVAGVKDKGQLAACKVDTQTLQTAMEANFAALGSYPTGTGTAAEQTLVTNGYLSTVSQLHGITSPPAGTTGYYVTENTGSPCGTGGDAVGGTVPTATTPQPPFTACTTGTQAGTGTGGWGDC